jgi:hypothetical protein
LKCINKNKLYIYIYIYTLLKQTLVLTRKTLIESSVWSIALYGTETWMILKEEGRKIEALETWCWRRTLKIPWTDRV